MMQSKRGFMTGQYGVNMFALHLSAISESLYQLSVPRRLLGLATIPRAFSPRQIKGHVRAPGTAQLTREPRTGINAWFLHHQPSSGEKFAGDEQSHVSIIVHVAQEYTAVRQCPHVSPCHNSMRRTNAHHGPQTWAK